MTWSDWKERKERLGWKKGIKSTIMTTPSSQGITQLLHAWSDGDQAALEKQTLWFTQKDTI